MNTVQVVNARIDAEILEQAAKITERMRATHPDLAERRDVPQVPHLLRELADIARA